MYKSEQLKELFTALAKAQAEMPIAGLNKKNPFFKSSYADLMELVRVSRPVLTKNGLSVTQIILKDETSKEVLHTILGHNSGEWLESRMTLNPSKTDPQSLASYLSYLKRYSYAAIVGVVASDEDDDGESAVIRPQNGSYNGYSKPVEVVTKEQHDMLQNALANSPKLAEEILKSMNINSLEEYPKNQFEKGYNKIRDLVAAGRK